MITPGYYYKPHALIEGQSYPFKYVKLIKLADDENYMVFEDIFGIRHLLPDKHYLKYNLRPGNTINCLVDRINCTGRVFLEPVHPHYLSGKDYTFAIISIASDSMIVRDILNNEIVLNTINTNGISVGVYIICEVERISKGKPVLIFKEVITQ